MATRDIQFTVTGRGEFPLDMLRYDACYPYSQQDVTRLEHTSGDLDQGHRATRDVQLVHTVSTRATAWRPTEGRWSSFGWHVSDIRVW